MSQSHQSRMVSPLHTGVRAGVSVVILREGLVLVGTRCGSHAPGLLNLPGGSIEFGESAAEAGRREVWEETGLQVVEIESLPLWADDPQLEYGKHYMSVFLYARAEGEPRVMEPERCLGWQWARPEELEQEELMPGTLRAVQAALLLHSRA